MKKAEITFKQPAPRDITKKDENEKPDSAIDRRNKRKLDMLNKQKERYDKRIKELKKTLARNVISRFLSAQDSPNDDPQYLWGQVRPTLGKMGIANICQNNKTQLVIGESDKDKSLYKVVIRRQSEIGPDTIDRIKRQSDSLKNIIWSNEGIVFYVWAPYISPTPEAPEEGAPTS